MQIIILLVPRKIRLSSSGFQYSVGGKKRFSVRWSDITFVKSTKSFSGKKEDVRLVFDILVGSSILNWLGVTRWPIYPRWLGPRRIINQKGLIYRFLTIEAGKEKIAFGANIHFTEKELEEIMRIIVLMHMAHKNIRVEDNIGWATAEYRDGVKYI